ncbi:hypothetical protein ACFVH6_42395 [Spirillospora sp. NPDC127200]
MADIVEWGYAIERTTGDHRKGPMINPKPIGYPRNGTLAVAFEFTFDRNSRTTCGNRFDARALRRPFQERSSMRKPCALRLR